MTTEELTRTAVSAEVRATVENKLTAVNAAIAEQERQLQELYATRTWLEGVLAAAVDSEPASAPDALPLPAPQAQPTTVTAVPVAEPAGSADKDAGPQPAPKRRRSSARREIVQRRGAAEPSLPQRVQQFLTEHPGPQKAAEVAQGLFGANVVTANINATRAALEALLKRGAVEKSKQGSTVYYEAAPGEASAPAN